MRLRRNVAFTEIPEWAYVGKEPSVYTFYEAMALVGLEGVNVRLSADTQKKILGHNVFGQRNIFINGVGDVVMTVSACFGQDYEQSTYPWTKIRDAALAKKQIRPGTSGKKYC